MISEAQKTALLNNAVFFGDSNSGFVFDNRKFLQSVQTSDLLNLMTDLWNKIKQYNPEILVGKGIGSFPMLSTLKIVAWQQDNIDLEILFVRDSRKARGLFKKTVEGSYPEELKKTRAIFIDDIFNSGSTYRSTVDTLFDEGFNLNFVAVGVLVDFWNKSRQLRVTGTPVEYVLRRHDLGLTRSDSGLPPAVGNLNWRTFSFHTGVDYMKIKSAPAVDNNTLYLGNDNTSLYAFDLETGAIKWICKSTNPVIKGTVCVAKTTEKSVIFSSYDGTVKNVDKHSGNINWISKLDQNLHSSPCLDEENDIMYVGTEWDKNVRYGRGDIVAIKISDGTEVWRTPTRGMIPCSPILVDNIVICGSNDFHVYGLDSKTGNILFKIPTKGEVKGKPLYVNGIVVAISNYGHAIGFDLSGAIKWTRQLSKNCNHSYPVTNDKLVYIGTDANYVLAIDPLTGLIKWASRVRGGIGWGVICYKDKVISVTYNGHIIVHDQLTGKKLAKSIMQDRSVFIYQPPIVYNDKLIISTNNSGVFCYDLTVS